MRNNSSNKIPIIIISVGLVILAALAAYYILVLKDKPKEVLEYKEKEYSAVAYDEEGNKYINGQLVVNPGIKYSLNDGNMTVQELTNTYLEFITTKAKLYIPSKDCFTELNNIKEGNLNEEDLPLVKNNDNEETSEIPEEILNNTIESEEVNVEPAVVSNYTVEVTLSYSNVEAKDFIADIYLSSDEGIIEPVSNLDKDNSVIVKFYIPCTIHPDYLKLNYGVIDYLTITQKQLNLIVEETIVNGEASQR